MAHCGAHLVDARTGCPPAAIAGVIVIGESLVKADLDAAAAYALAENAAGDCGPDPDAAASSCGRTVQPEGSAPPGSQERRGTVAGSPQQTAAGWLTQPDGPAADEELACARS